jgi:hypothetical protein
LDASPEAFAQKSEKDDEGTKGKKKRPTGGAPTKKRHSLRAFNSKKRKKRSRFFKAFNHNRLLPLSFSVRALTSSALAESLSETKSTKMMARSIANAIAVSLAALALAIATMTSTSFATAAPLSSLSSLSSSRKLLENYWRRSGPGFYPGDADGWTELGWGPDGRYYYSLNGYKGYFSAGCFGCGRWSGGGPSNSAAAASSSGGGGAAASASAGPSFSGCGRCQAWGGSSCVSVPSNACSLSGIPDSCDVCSFWTQDQGCVRASGCGVDFATNAFSTSSSSSSSGGSSSSSSSGSSYNNGNNAVYFSNGNGGNGVAVSSGPGAWAGPSGNNGVFASSGGGSASSFAGPGGASAFAGK